MIRNSRRVVALAVAGAVAIAPALAGCAAGDEPQSAAPTRLTEGVNVQLPTAKPAAAQIELRNMFLLGADRGTTLPPGSSLALYGALINQVEQRADRLVSVSSPAFSGVQIKGGSLTIPAAAGDGTGGMVKLHGEPAQQPAPTDSPTGQSPAPTPAETGPGATSMPTQSPTSENTVAPDETGLPVTPVPGGGEPLVVLTGLNQELVPGSTVRLRMQFEHAGTIEFDVPVAPHQDEYATYPVPTPAGQRQEQNGQPTGSPSPGENTASPAPGGSPGATESP